MIERLRRCWVAVLRSVRLRPPHGHMKMLRDVIDRWEDDRVAREARAETRQASGEWNRPTGVNERMRRGVNFEPLRVSARWAG